jgi:phospholipid/cholesterol/gamma-HCH transport system substrate-binding protein
MRSLAASNLLTKKRLLKMLIAPVSLAVLAAATIVAVKASDGAFSGAYPIYGIFSRAGEGLGPNSLVSYRGVTVGHVVMARLDGTQAKVKMDIEPSFRIPRNASATIEPLNLFGAEQVVIHVPHPGDPPWLQPGSTIKKTSVSDQLQSLLNAADPLLSKLNPTDLTESVHALATAFGNEGKELATSITEGAKLANFLDRTLPAQIRSLDALDAASGSLVPDAPLMNEIAKESNAALPVLNSAAPSYEKLLKTLEPFGNQLASLLADYHPDFARLLKDGDNISLLLLEHRQQVVDLVKGLASFFFTLSRDSTEALPNGTHFDYFQTFVMFSQVNNLVCSLLAPLEPGLSFLEPLQQAVAGAGTPLDCSKRFSAFDALQEPQKKSAVSQVRTSQPAPVKTLPIELTVFAIVALAILGWLAVKIGQFQLFASTDTYHAVLTDATGLNTGNAVKIAGVTVGRVSGITVRHGEAYVTFTVSSKVKIPRSSGVGIQWHNLIGEKYLYIYPGGSNAALDDTASSGLTNKTELVSARYLPPGGTIPASHDVETPSVGALLNSLEPLLSAINPKEANELVTGIAAALAGEHTQVRSLLSSAATVSRTVGDLDLQIGTTIQDLDAVASALSAHRGALGALIGNLDSLASSLASRNSLVDQSVENLARVGHNLSAVVGTNQHALHQIIGDLDTVAKEVQSHDGELSNALSHLSVEGLAPFVEISSYGQWFQIQTVYSCMAGGDICNYYEPTNPPAGSGPLGSPPLAVPGAATGESLPPPLGSSTGTALGSSPRAALQEIMAGPLSTTGGSDK